MPSSVNPSDSRVTSSFSDGDSEINNQTHACTQYKDMLQMKKMVLYYDYTVSCIIHTMIVAM